MSDYTQITFFAPKDALASGNPSKLIKGTEVDPELSAIATAIATKYDSGDVANTTEAAAGTSDAKLMTPSKTIHLLENATFDLSDTVTKGGLALVLADRTVTAGAGLTDGGALSSNITINVGAGTGITVNANDVALDTSSSRNVDHSAVSISAGGALTGGGTIAANRTITLDVNGLTEETGVLGATDFVLIYDVSAGAHRKAKPDNLMAGVSGFVPNARNVIAGAGMTGGGTLASDVTLNVIAGTGITVNANDVQLDTASTRNTDHSGVSISAGTGLTGGGDISASRSLALDTSSTRNTDHASVTLTASTGLTGGGDISASRSFAVDRASTTATTAVGYLDAPENQQADNYTCVIGDRGKLMVQTGSSKTFTIPANASVAYPVGTVLSFTSLNASVSIAITTDTMYLAGTSTTGTRTLLQRGIATAVKVASTTWFISGTGLS